MTPSTDSHQIDLEIKDAQVIFSTVWETLEEELGHANLRFPKELILLGGAPGAGKGTHTQFIMKARGLTCQPIVVSSLLDTPEMQALKNRGSMVGDKEAGEVRSASSNQCLALMRLEYLEAPGAEFLADGVRLTPQKPVWAKF